MLARLFAKLLAVPLVVLSLLPFAAPLAAATLTGDTVTSQYYFPTGGNLLGTDTSIVGAGVEIACPGASGVCGIGLLGTYTVDFTSDTISFDQQLVGSNAYTGAAFNGWVFSSLDFGTAITSLDLFSYGIAGLDASRLSFTNDTITLNLQGLAVEANNGWRVRLNPVPVPASGVLLVVGLGGLALMRRRQS